jgi:hypothetical protein
LERKILFGQPEVLNKCFKGEELLYVLSDIGGDPGKIIGLEKRREAQLLVNKKCSFALFFGK